MPDAGYLLEQVEAPHDLIRPMHPDKCLHWHLVENGQAYVLHLDPHCPPANP